MRAGARRTLARGAVGLLAVVGLAAAAGAARPRGESVEARLTALLEAPERLEARAPAAEPVPRTLGTAPLAWAPAAALTPHRDVAPGVDLAFAIEESRLESLWVVRPGADPASIRLDFPGARSVALGEGGALVVATGGVVVTFAAPAAYQEDPGRRGERTAVEGGYRLAGPERAEVTVGEYDPARPLYVRVAAAAAGGPLPNSVPPTVTATLVDTPPTPPGAQPGDTIDYTAEIGATGMTATGVQVDFSNADDANVDLLPGTVKVTPVAADDAFAAVGNTQVAVTDSANGVLANDFDPDNPTPVLGTDLFVAPGSVSKTGGTVAGSGSLTISADGTFTYTPPAGETGTEIFQYTARDGDGLDSVDPGFLTFTIADMVWYIDNAGGGSGGTGTSDDPFKTLADFMAVQGGGAGAPAAGDFIRLRTGASAYDSSAAASLALLDNQKLIGQGADLVVGLQTIETGGAGQEPTITNTGGTPGAGIDLASGNTVRGLDVGATPGAGILGTSVAGGTIDKVGVTDSSAGGIRLVGATGTFTFDSLDIDSTSGAAGIALEISGGSADVTVNGDITQGLNASAVSIGGGHSGTFDFQSGTISATNGNGLQFDDADGTYSFSGTTTLNGGDAGIDILGNSNGTFTFDSLTSITNPTGGAFKLVGDGANSPTVTYSGTIANSAGDAVSIQSTAAGNTITFDGAAADAIADGSAGTGIFLSSVAQDVDFSADVELGGAEGIDVDGGSGTFTFSDTDIVDPGAAAIDVNGGSATVEFGANSSIAQSNSFPAVSISNGHSGAFTQTANASPAADAGTIGATSGTGLQFDDADGTYAFNGTVTLAGGDAGIDILNGSSGGFDFSAASSISNPTGIAFRIDTSTGGNVTYAGTIVQTSAASAVRVNAKTGGMATFSGAVTAGTGSATGIDLAGNSGATITFSGGLDVDTTTGTGFSATGGGILNVTGTNTVNTTETSGGAKDAGSAVVLSGMTLGASDVTFSTIAVAGGTAAGKPAIDVDSTSNAGTFFGGDVTVAGTGVGAAGIDVNASSAAFDFTSATIDNTGAAGIKLAGANGAVTFDTVDVDGTTGHGIEISGNTNTVLIDAGTIGASTTSGMDGVNVSGGSGDVTVDATIKQMSANNSVDVSGRTGGAVTFTGSIDDDAGGIRLASNGGSTIGFTGSLALDTGTSTAFSATGGGTVFATGANSTIGASSAVSRRAVQITGTGIGASGVTFKAIFVDGGNVSTVPAIELADTGTGTFTITGDNGPCGNTMAALDCDGGTLQKLRADAIALKNTGGLVTLNYLRIQDIGDMTTAGFDHRSQHDAIHGEAVAGGLTLDDVLIRRVSDQGINGALFSDGVGETSWTNLTLQDSLIEDTNRFTNACGSAGSACVDDLDEAAVRIFGIKGTVLVDNSKLQRGGELLTLFTDDVAGTLTVTVTRSEFRDAAKLFAYTPGAKGKACFNFSARGPMNANLTLGDKTNAALGNTFHDCGQASVVVAQDSSTGASGHVNLVVAKNTFEVDNHTSLFVGTPCDVGGFNFPQGGLAIKPSGSSTASLDALIQDNLLDELMHADGGFGQLTIVTDSGNTSQIKVKGNTFAKAFDQPWRIVADGASTSTILFEGNTHTSDMVNVPECGGDVHTPFAPNTLNVRNGSVVDAVFKGEVMVQHDVPNFGADEQFNATLQTSGASLCLDLDGNANPNRSPDGYGLSCSGDCTLPLPRNAFNLEKGVSDSGPCDACGSALLADVVSDNGNTGTGGTGTATPPFVNDSGAINIVSTACKEPSGSIF